MLTRQRVVVTGLGVVAPSGIGKGAFWDSLLTCKSGIGPITLFDARAFKSKIAGEVKNFDLLDYHEPKTRVDRLARHTQFALAAAKEAITDAGLLRYQGGEAGGHIPVILGVSSSAMDVVAHGNDRLLSRGPARVPTYIIDASIPQQAASVVSQELGFSTRAQTISSACAAGLEAIGEATSVIQFGKADIAVAGGGDAHISPLPFACLDKAGLASRRNDDPEHASRPFDRDCDSGVISEGTGVVILENLEHALARGAHIYCEIQGFGRRGDPDLAEPASGMGDAMEIALANAGRRPEDVDFICAHGPGHPVIDRIESEAIKCVFGQAAYRVPVTSIKGVVGNPVSGAGPMQLIASACVIESGLIPPTANLEHPAPGCDLDYVTREPRLARVRCALINVHGLGGGNDCMVVERMDDV